MRRGKYVSGGWFKKRKYFNQRFIVKCREMC